MVAIPVIDETPTNVSTNLNLESSIFIAKYLVSVLSPDITCPLFEYIIYFSLNLLKFQKIQNIYCAQVPAGYRY